MYQTKVWPKTFEKGSEIWYFGSRVPRMFMAALYRLSKWEGETESVEFSNGVGPLFFSTWAFCVSRQSYSLAGATSNALHRHLVAHPHHLWVGQSEKKAKFLSLAAYSLTIVPIFSGLCSSFIFSMNNHVLILREKKDMLWFAIDYISLSVALVSVHDNYICWPS